MSPSNVTEKRSSRVAHLSRDFQIAVFILMRLTKPPHFTSTPCTTFCAHFVLKRLFQSDSKGISPIPRVLFWDVQNALPGSWVVLPHIPKAFTSLGLPFPSSSCVPQPAKAGGLWSSFCCLTQDFRARYSLWTFHLSPPLCWWPWQMSGLLIVNIISVNLSFKETAVVGSEQMLLFLEMSQRFFKRLPCSPHLLTALPSAFPEPPQAGRALCVPTTAAVLAWGWLAFRCDGGMFFTWLWRQFEKILWRCLGNVPAITVQCLIQIVFFTLLFKLLAGELINFNRMLQGEFCKSNYLKATQKC